MSWTSILPPCLSLVETWIIRIFLLLGLLTIGPWALLIVYDVLLYIFRALTYGIPYVGGRARGRQRPRAPSLAERPSGHRRAFSIGGSITSGGASDDKEGLRERSRKTSALGNSSTFED
ncbi:hypothetical protein MMC08_008897 [Hypocenomyce scalaris]|nr:hypothetical protein [Hypocenomyce scalaris]